MKTSNGFLITLMVAAFVSGSSYVHGGIYGGGSGIDEAPYQIGTAAHWQELMTTPADWGDSFVLTGDIDLQGVTLTPVGNNAERFTGVLDGNGYNLRNATLALPDTDYVALFGFLGNDGWLKNLDIENLSVSGRIDVGGLVAGNSGTVSNCRITGTVRGDSHHVGGVCGTNYGTIESSYAAGVVTGLYNIGGLCGRNYQGTIRNCYASGSVNGCEKVGGLCGWNVDGSIVHCYSSGKVSGDFYGGGFCGLIEFGPGYEDIGNLWDMESSQVVTSSMGDGKTTAEMKTLATFTDAGWDFSDIDGDGADWWLPADDYPRLIWETILSFSPDHGVYWGTQHVMIRSSAPAATIHYTITGNEPTQSDPVIASGSILPISQSMTLKAKAWLAGMIPSETKTAAYTIKRICPAGDLDGDCKVDMRDFAIVSQWWLEICDVTNGWCGGVDLDLSGVIDLGELEDVTADNLDEEQVVNHVKEFTIQVLRDYGDAYIQQYYGKSMTHDVSVQVATDGAVTAIEFTTPSGNTFTMSSASYAWREPYPGGLLSGGRGMLGPDWFLWEYQVMFFNADSLSAYGDGYYDFTIHYADGGTQQTSVWFGIPDTADPIPTPMQVPAFTTITNGGTVSSPVSFNWQPCTDPAVQYIGMGVVYGDYWGFEDATPTGLDAPVPLSPGEHDAWIYFETYYYFETEDGISVGVGKHNQSHYTFTVN